MQDTLSVCSWN